MNKRDFTIAASTTFAIALLLASPAHATVLHAGGSGIPTVFGFNLGAECGNYAIEEREIFRIVERYAEALDG